MNGGKLYSDIEVAFFVVRRLLYLSGCAPKVEETFVISDMVSQQIVNAIDSIRSLLVSALSEDESGFSHHFVPTAVFSLIGLILSIDKYSQTINESFQCEFGTYKIRYKIPSPSQLPKQIQSILSANKIALDSLLKAYGDVLAECTFTDSSYNKYLHDKLTLIK